MTDGRRLRLRGGRLIDPAVGVDLIADLLIEDGLIVGYGAELGAADGEQTVNLGGAVVAPGLIDLHVHLREPGGEDRETIATGTRAAAAGGFTAICAMPDTDPTIDTASDVAALLGEAARSGLVRVFPLGTITKRRRGEELSELADLAAAGAVAFSDDDRPVRGSRIMRHALEYSRMVGRPIVDHAEDADLGRDAVMHEGAVSALLGLRGQPAAAEEIAVARDIALLRHCGGRLHLAHLTTAGAVELVRRAKADGLAVTAEVTAHHLTLTDALVAGGGPRSPFDSSTRVQPPLRSSEHQEALIAGLADGTIDAIVTDHSPLTIVDKQCEFDLAAAGISGLETALGLCLKLVHEGRLTLLQLLERLTAGPARVFGLPGGSLHAGAAADVVIFDPDLSWTVQPDRFFSKGKNTPLGGMELRGRARATLVGGRLVHGALS